MIIARGMFTGTESITLQAAAKVNIYLQVLGRRRNGYHDLKSVVVPVDLHDEVVLTRQPGGIETEVVDGDVSAEVLCREGATPNLATRAAEMLKESAGYEGGALIRLRKSIPLGGGLGGGSADAAAVLRGLNDLWSTGLSCEELMAIGSRLGCDVPALVHGGAVCMEGLGETVKPIETGGTGWDRDWWLVIANPGFCVSTRDIYERVGSALTSGPIPYTSMVSALSEGDADTVARGLFNGLEATVFAKYPLIEMTAEELQRAGALGVLLCGSGASVFGLAGDRAHASQVAADVAARCGETVWTVVTRLVPDGVMVAHGPLEA